MDALAGSISFLIAPSVQIHICCFLGTWYKCTQTCWPHLLIYWNLAASISTKEWIWGRISIRVANEYSSKNFPLSILQDGDSLTMNGSRNPNRRLTEGFSTHLDGNPQSATTSSSSRCNTLTLDFVSFWSMNWSSFYNFLTFNFDMLNTLGCGSLLACFDEHDDSANDTVLQRPVPVLLRSI